MTPAQLALEIDAAEAISEADWRRGEERLEAESEARPKPPRCRCERPLELEEPGWCAACGREIR